MRVYINNFDGDRMWSVDDGSISTETRWHEVRILCPSFTEADLSKRGSKTDPCCWINAQGFPWHGNWESDGILVIR